MERSTPVGMPLNPAQARAVRATFMHVSELLDSVLKLARAELNPFDRERPDLTRAEARRVAALVTTLRQSMLEAMKTLDVPPPRPEGSARWSARTSFLFGEIALSELSGNGLRAYGAMDAETEQLVSAVVQDLQRSVHRAEILLKGVDPGSVEALVDRVEGPTGAVIRQIWSFVLRHELVDVYHDVAAVAERAAAPAADVGVFGRTNAGKSSLINALVASEVLPVGAVPMTAIPLRLARGPAVLRLRKADGPDEDQPIESLSQYTLEAIGTGETEIVAMDAFVPTAPAGLRFVDTPGVGTYATPAGAQAFEWLPRCDLGILLVPAGSVLEAEDAALVRGLTAAGVDVAVVLSKADLVGAVDLEKSMQHVHRQLQRVLEGRAPRILPLSTTSGQGSGLDELRRTILEPLAGERRDPSAERLGRRLTHLVGLVEAAYDGRPPGSLEIGSNGKLPLEGARRSVDEILDRLRRAAPRALDDAADALAEAWADGCADTLGRVGPTLSAPAEVALEAVRKILDQAAQELPTSRGSEAFPMPPLFDAPLHDAGDLQPGPQAGWLLPHSRAVRRLAPAGAALAEAYRRYAQRLHTWAAAALEALAEGAMPEPHPESSGEIQELRRGIAALEADRHGAPSTAFRERRDTASER